MGNPMSSQLQYICYVKSTLWETINPHYLGQFSNMILDMQNSSQFHIQVAEMKTLTCYYRSTLLFQRSVWHLISYLAGNVCIFLLSSDQNGAHSQEGVKAWCPSHSTRCSKKYVVFYVRNAFRCYIFFDGTAQSEMCSEIAVRYIVISSAAAVSCWCDEASILCNTMVLGTLIHWAHVTCARLKERYTGRSQ